MRGLERAVVEQHPVVGEDADLVAPDVSVTANHRGAVVGLVFVEARPVYDPGQNLAHVELGFPVLGNDPVKLLRVVVRFFIGRSFDDRFRCAFPLADNLARQ